jgi:hypothetical protein
MITKKSIWISVLFFAFITVTGLFVIHAEADVNSAEQLIENAAKNFRQGNIQASLYKINTSNYSSGLRKALSFAAKLHLYVDYEKSIIIEKNRKLLQCRENSPDSICPAIEIERIDKEIQILEINVEEDVDTFRDHIRHGLYLCDEVSQELGPGLYNDKTFKEKIHPLLHNNNDLKTLEANKERLLQDNRLKNEVADLIKEIDRWYASNPETDRQKPIVPSEIVDSL